MEQLSLDQGAAWAFIAPMIQARQQQIAAKREAETTAAPVEAATRTAPSTDKPAAPGQLSEDEQAVVAEMAARDAEVRRHEEAHARVGGQYASAPSYTFQTGPDGKNYAVGGEVQIDVAPVDGDPEATIDKMDVVKAAALAPAEPSAADRAVASLADRQRGAAMAELNRMRMREQQGAPQVDHRV